MGVRATTFTLDLSDYEEAEREAIALEVIDRIIKRTKGGKDKNGDPFAPYSKGYENSLEFKIAAKSGRVNLTLSGDMLDAMEIVDNFQNGKVKIGYDGENSQQGKAEGNITGTYGGSGGPARDYLGISESELSTILRKYPAGTEKAANRAKERLLKEGESVRLSGNINFDDLED